MLYYNVLSLIFQRVLLFLLIFIRCVSFQDLGGEQSPTSILQHCQAEAGHQLPLSSYLLKPMQRLTKYQLLLKDLVESSNVVCGRPELEEALTELLSVVKVVNDSMSEVAIKGLPGEAKPLGTLNCQEVFQVGKILQQWI